MAKDAKGHGSEKRGGDVAGNIQQAYKNAATLGPDHPSVGSALQAAARAQLAAHQGGVEAASKGLFTDTQIAVLKEGYAKIKSVDPIQPSYGRLTALLDRSSPAQLKQLAGAGIKFVSPLAQNRVSRSGKSDYTADRIYGDRRDLRD